MIRWKLPEKISRKSNDFKENNWHIKITSEIPQSL